MTSGKPGFSGRIENADLMQLIQMVCMSGQNVEIIVRGEGRDGLILVYGGSIVHAEAEGFQGEDAIYRMATWEKHVCEFSPLYEEPKERTVGKDWQYVLLEAAKVQDEQRIRKKIKVLIVDDSEFFARQLKKVIDEDNELTVVGIASNGHEAVEFLKEKCVDVVVLDIFMPVMKGDTALKHIMLKFSVPTVIMSAFPEKSEEKLFEFLCLGAVDVFPKPELNKTGTVWQEEFRKRLKRAARACVYRFRLIKPGRDHSKSSETYQKTTGLERKESLTIFVGGEASHAEWFRLPLREACSEGIVVALSTLHPAILPIMADLIKGKLHCDCIIHETGEITGLLPGRLHLLRSDFRWSIAGLAEDGGWLVKASEKADDLTDAAVAIAGSAIELGFKSVEIVVLSGAGEFSSDIIKDLLSRGVRFRIPPIDNLVFSCMAESVVRSVNSSMLGKSVILADGWDDLMPKFEGEIHGGGTCK